MCYHAGVYAVEVGYAHKWAEAIGQSLYYSRMTGKKPEVVLIMLEEGDQRFAGRLRAVAQQQGIRVWTVKLCELVYETVNWLSGIILQKTVDRAKTLSSPRKTKR